MQQPHHKLVLGVEAESGGSDEEVADIGTTLTRVCVDGEEGVELLDGLSGEDRVLGANVLGEDGSQLLLLDFLL